MHRLPGVLPLVDDEAVAIVKAQAFRDVRDVDKALLDELRLFGVHVGKGGKVRFGHHQHVHLGLRVDVFEGDHVFVFIHLLRGDLPRSDLAENAVFHLVSSITKSK